MGDRSLRCIVALSRDLSRLFPLRGTGRDVGWVSDGSPDATESARSFAAADVVVLQTRPTQGPM